MADILALDLQHLMNLDEVDSAKMIAGSNGNLRLSFSLPDTYSSTSRSALAMSWLQSWYIAEQLAQISESVSCSVTELDHGVACFTFEIRNADLKTITTKLISWASAFNSDDLESSAELISEALDWVESREDTPSYFPELERAYLEDAEEADMNPDE